MENSFTSIEKNKIKLNVSLDKMVSHYLELVNKSSITCDILYEPSKGFISYLVDNKTLLIPDLYGDGRYWLQRAEELAREFNCNKLKGGTTRNPKAYNKMFGTKIVGYILEKEL